MKAVTSFETIQHLLYDIDDQGDPKLKAAIAMIEEGTIRAFERLAELDEGPTS